MKRRAVSPNGSRETRDGSGSEQGQAATLARLEHENMIEALVLGGRQVPGARAETVDGVALIATGLDLLIFNQALIADETADEDAVAAAVAVLRARGHDFVVSLRGGSAAPTGSTTSPPWSRRAAVALVPP